MQDEKKNRKNENLETGVASAFVVSEVTAKPFEQLNPSFHYCKILLRSRILKEDSSRLKQEEKKVDRGIRYP